MNFNSEIERKFFVKNMPDLSGIRPVRSERYFLNISDLVEERITKTGLDTYVYEKKIVTSSLSRNETVRPISHREFDSLIPTGMDPIIRIKYQISQYPNTSVMVYKDKFEGLVRAEVEFSSMSDAEAYIPVEWMGSEITGLPIARDSKLVKMTREELKSFLFSTLGGNTK